MSIFYCKEGLDSFETTSKARNNRRDWARDSNLSKPRNSNCTWCWRRRSRATRSERCPGRVVLAVRKILVRQIECEDAEWQSVFGGINQIQKTPSEVLKGRNLRCSVRVMGLLWWQSTWGSLKYSIESLIWVSAENRSTKRGSNLD